MTNMLTHGQLDQQVAALRRAGKSRREIKQILGVGNSTLDRALRGVPPPKWTRRPRAKDDLRIKARELRARGYTYVEIAAELGVSRSSVSLWVRDMPRAGRLSHAEIRSRKAEGAARYWASEGLRREARRQAVQGAAATEIGALSDREIMIKRHNPKTIRKNTGADYHGCLAIRVRGGADLYRRIDGWATAVMSGQLLDATRVSGEPSTLSAAEAG